MSLFIIIMTKFKVFQTEKGFVVRRFNEFTNEWVDATEAYPTKEIAEAMASYRNELTEDDAVSSSSIDNNAKKDVKVDPNQAAETTKGTMYELGKAVGKHGNKVLTVVKVLVAAFLVFFAIGFVWTNFVAENTSKTQIDRPDNYTLLKRALNDGTVHLGMTYEQISDIVGETGSVSRSNGRVKYAYYSPYTPGRYSSAEIQLCFDEYGHLYNWNESN